MAGRVRTSLPSASTRTTSRQQHATHHEASTFPRLGIRRICLLSQCRGEFVISIVRRSRWTDNITDGAPHEETEELPMRHIVGERFVRLSEPLAASFRAMMPICYSVSPANVVLMNFISSFPSLWPVSDFAR